MRSIIVSLFLLTILTAVILIFPLSNAAAPAGPINSVGEAKLLRPCQVSTQGGALNVRDNYDRIIAKLPNRTRVNVITNDDDGFKYLITVRLNGRGIRGWVAAEFISCR